MKRVWYLTTVLFFLSSNSFAYENIDGSWRLINTVCENGASLPVEFQNDLKANMRVNVGLELNGDKGTSTSLVSPSKDSSCKEHKSFNIRKDDAILYLDYKGVNYTQCSRFKNIGGFLQSTLVRFAKPPTMELPYKITLEEKYNGDKVYRLEITYPKGYYCGEAFRHTNVYERVTKGDQSQNAEDQGLPVSN